MLKLSRPVRVNWGYYTGDGATANKTVAHGLGVKPKLVIINWSLNTALYTIIIDEGKINYIQGNNNYDVTAPTATYFYVGNVANWNNSANANGVQFVWVAFG